MANNKENKSEGTIIDLLNGTIEKVNMVLNTVYDAMDEDEKSLMEEAMGNVVKAKMLIIGLKKDVISIIDECTPVKESNNDQDDN